MGRKGGLRRSILQIIFVKIIEKIGAVSGGNFLFTNLHIFNG